MPPRSPLMNIMVRAAQRAARGLKRDFGEIEQLQVSRKGPADFVSTADMNADRVLCEELTKGRPDFGIMSEEGSLREPDSEGRRWIVDPLDGTSNFLHGLPHFAISIGLEQRGNLLAAVVYDPIKDELFHAEKGGGAFLNDRRLRVSGRRSLNEALIGTGMPFKGHGDSPRFLEELGRIVPEVAGVRRWGSAALDLAYVAAGRYDGFWERDLKAWDVAGGALLVREAGGYLSAIDGRDFTLEGGSILATNSHLHADLAGLLAGRTKTPKAS
ncbi:MAG: inositol monophosphatase family protein [Rhodospirillales bacterium]